MRMAINIIYTILDMFLQIMVDDYNDSINMMQIKYLSCSFPKCFLKDGIALLHGLY